MKITFLGTGTSQGIPIIGCNCKTCRSDDPRDKRLRSSILIEIANKHILIDCGPDFRQQMIRENIKQLDAIIFTHDHRDHIAGLDDIRAFNYINQKHMDVYAEKRVIKVLKNIFSYAFAEEKYPGVPEINTHEISNQPFIIDSTKIIPIRGFHHKLPIFGYRIKDFTYITDFSMIPVEEKEKIKGTKYLVVNALRREQHISHFTLDEALALVKEIKPQQAYLTHLSHQMGLNRELKKELPNAVSPAYDGLQITCCD